MYLIELVSLTVASLSTAVTVMIVSPRGSDSGIAIEYVSGWNIGENKFLVTFTYTTVVSVREGLPPSEAKTRIYSTQSKTAY